MKRYFSLVKTFFNYHLIRNLEFRSEVIGWSIISIMWPLLTLLSVHLIFGQVDSMAGWTKSEVLITVCLYEIFIGLIWIFIVPSIRNFTQSIKKGEFDFYLTKPINSRFIASVNFFEFDQYPRLLMLAGILFLFLRQQGDISLVNVLFGLFLLVVGLVVYYNIFFFIATFIFWIIAVINLEDLFNSLILTGRYPIYIFQKGLFSFFTFVIPAAFIATFPAQAMLGKINYNVLFIAGFVLLTTSIISQWFWNFALKRYSSASS